MRWRWESLVIVVVLFIQLVYSPFYSLYTFSQIALGIVHFLSQLLANL